MPQERGTRGVPAVEISGFDTSPPAPNTRSLLQAQDGYTPLNFVPAQYNPDGQATGAKAGKVTYKAYKFPGQRGNMIAGICNGADSPSTSYGDAGKYRLAYTSLASTSPASEYGSQNTASAEILPNILVTKTTAANTLYAIDKDTLAFDAVTSALSGTNLVILCGQIASQFAAACQFFVYRTGSPSNTYLRFGKYEDGVVSNTGSNYNEGYSGTINMTSWFPDLAGDGIWVIDAGFVSASGRLLYHVTSSGVTGYEYDAGVTAIGAQVGTSIAPFGDDSEYFIAIAHTTGTRNNHHFMQMHVGAPTATEFNLVSQYNNFVFFQDASQIMGAPADLYNFSYYANQLRTWQRADDGYYYFIATPPYVTWDGGSGDAVAYFPRTNLYKVGFTVDSGIIDNYTTPIPSVTFTPTVDGNVGSVCTLKDLASTTITNVSLTTNIATITVADSTLFAVDDVVNVACSNDIFDVTGATITGVNNTNKTISFSLVHANVTSVAATGTVTDTGNLDVIIMNPNMAILSGGSVCVIGDRGDDLGVASDDKIAVFLNSSKVQVAAISFPYAGVNIPKGVCAFNDTQYLFTGYKGSTTTAWAAIYDSSGNLVSEATTANGGSSPGIGPFDPYGKRTGSA